MHLTRIASAKKAGFKKKSLRVRKEMPRQTSLYMKQKSSFFIAVLSLVAFITGNMVGEHGIYAFMKAALGAYDDSLITYTGTVPPIAFVPDYKKWATYGGNAEDATYRQVPETVLVPLPVYDSTYEKSKPAGANSDVYSVAYMGDYKIGKEGGGSHLAVDIRAPIGTPIRAMASGQVTTVSNDAYGFGLYIVIRHPHIPDPANPDYETVLHSSYSHLSAQLVQVGDIVQKGQQIGLSGKSGDASGPHLHFQVDRDTVEVDGKTVKVPWHPYWPFTSQELRDNNLNNYTAINSGFRADIGYKYTVNPMLFSQASLPPAKYKEAAPVTTVAMSTHPAATTSAVKAARTTFSIARTATSRKAQRLSTTRFAVNNAVIQKQTIVSGTQSPQSLAPAPVIISEPVATITHPATSAGGRAVKLSVQPNHYEERKWQTVRVTFLDENGSGASTKDFPEKVYLTFGYGDGEFQKPYINRSDIKDGSVTIQLLPRGTQTVVLAAPQLSLTSNPMKNVTK